VLWTFLRLQSVSFEFPVGSLQFSLRRDRLLEWHIEIKSGTGLMVGEELAEGCCGWGTGTFRKTRERETNGRRWKPLPEDW
jgi:hypothetical protein